MMRRYMGEIDDDTRNSEFGSTLIEKIYRGRFGEKEKNEKIEKNVLFCENLLHPPRNLDAFIYFSVPFEINARIFCVVARRALDAAEEWHDIDERPGSIDFARDSWLS